MTPIDVYKEAATQFGFMVFHKPSNDSNFATINIKPDETYTKSISVYYNTNSGEVISRNLQITVDNNSFTRYVDYELKILNRENIINKIISDI
tara:strand:- start:593 stop:871 length:279 start_codon:yes stop_codon:yes gene_type:complete